MSRTMPSAEELDAMNDLHKVKNSDPQALIRLRSDLDKMIRNAEFPRLTMVEVDKEALGVERLDVEAKFNAAKGAEALRWANRLDELDEQIDGPARLYCPVCAEDISADDLFCVDISTRLTACEEIDPDERGGSVAFVYDDTADYEGSHYQHGDGSDAHAVNLPDGWEEI